MIKIGLVGLGKMGMSHHAIFNSHPDLKVVAACESSSYVNEVLSKYSGLKCYSDYDKLIANEQLDAVVISTPSKLHASMVETAMNRSLDVFCEKPFVLDVADGDRLVALAAERQRVTQVGYHYRFVGAFAEAARLVQAGLLGKVHHLRAEAHGPVVLRPKGGTWRSAKSEGGGALYDYACHALDLVNFIHQVPSAVSGVVRQGVFSKDVDDEVYCTLHFSDGGSGHLSVNWSDESQRKMSTKVTVWGTNGKLVVDRQEVQIYLRSVPDDDRNGLQQGWNVRYTTDLTQEVWYYLRGEEYSAQVDYFAKSIASRRLDGMNSFASALQADHVVQKILDSASGSVQPAVAAAATGSKGLISRIFG